MNSAITILYQIAIMFILIMLGFFLYKKGSFTRRGCNQLSNFILSTVCPVLIFTSFQKELEAKLIKGLLMAFIFSFIAHVILILLGTIFCSKRKGEDAGVERFAVAYSNCAFLGIPLIEAVYGTDGIFYLTAYIAMFNLLSWTHGIMTITDRLNFKSAINALKAPAVIATFVGLVFFFLQISLPDVVMQPLNYIASLNTPLAMLVSGMTIARSDLKNAIKKSGIYRTGFLKLIVGPLILALVMMPIGADPVVMNTILISSACPTATSTVMFATKYDKNPVYASEIFALSTIASAFTIPLVMMIASLFM